MEEEVELKEWGNSYAIRIPKKLAKRHGFRLGQRLRYKLENVEQIDGFGLFKGIGSYKRDPNDDLRDL